MTNTLSEIEDQVGESGLNREQVLDFVRLLPSSDVLVVREMLDAWVSQLHEAGVEVDTRYIKRIASDFELHGRLLPDTIAGLPAQPVKTLKRPNIIEDHQ